MDTPPDLVVLDGTAMLFRAFYSMRPIQSRSGAEVGAVLGVCQQLVGVVRRARARHLAVVFDVSRDTFRREIEPSYKATRKDPPPELPPQVSIARRAVKGLGFHVEAQRGFEADDLMATLAANARRQGMGSWLVSPDKDLYQLVRDEAPPVRLFHWKRRLVLDAKAVTKTLGVPPERAVDYYALVGDSSDNIPGIKGVGPTAARALLSRWEDLDAIYAHLDDVPSLNIRGAARLRQRLEADRDQAYLARRLLALREDAPLDLDAQPGPYTETLRWPGPRPEARAWFDEELGFVAPFDHLRALHA